MTKVTPIVSTDTSAHPTAKALTRSRRVSALVPVLTLVALIVIVTAIQPGFLSIGTIQGQLVQAAPILLLALGLTPVILLGGIDLSVGALASLSAILLALLTPTLGFLGFVLVLGIGAGVGALVGLIQAKAQVPSFVVTLGALGLYSGLALVLSGATSRPLGAGAATVSWLNSTLMLVPLSFVVGLLLMGGLGWALHATTWGRKVYAIGSGEPAAIMSGISATRARVIAFAISGGFAALAAAFLTARTSYASPTMADAYLLPALAAVLVGGTAISGGVGSVWRSLIGALILVVVQAGLVVIGADPVVLNLAFGVLLIVAVAVTTDRKKLSIVK